MALPWTLSVLPAANTCGSPAPRTAPGAEEQRADCCRSSGDCHSSASVQGLPLASWHWTRDRPAASSHLCFCLHGAAPPAGQFYRLRWDFSGSLWPLIRDELRRVSLTFCAVISNSNGRLCSGNRVPFRGFSTGALCHVTEEDRINREGWAAVGSILARQVACFCSQGPCPRDAASPLPGPSGFRGKRDGSPLVRAFGQRSRSLIKPAVHMALMEPETFSLDGEKSRWNLGS